MFPPPDALSNRNRDTGGIGAIFVSAGPAAVPLPLRVLEPSGDQVNQAADVGLP